MPILYQRSDLKTVNQKIQAIFNQQHLNHFGKPATPAEDFDTFSLAVWDDGTLIGGIVASQSYENYHIKGLAVDPVYQGQDIGSELIRRLESHAKNHQASSITLSTKSYQALGFYQKLGYQEYARLEDVPITGVTKYHLVKYL